MNAPIEQPLKVANPPAERPLMVFDGDCGFCRYWIARWKEATAGKINYLPYQAVATRFPEISLSDFQHAVQFIEPNGHVTSGADGVFRALDFAPRYAFFLGIAMVVPGFLPMARMAYAFIASHRTFFSFLTRLFWGKSLQRPSYLVARAVFIRLLGVIYLIAFLSLLPQILGLSGSHGIMPVAQLLDSVKNELGPARYWRFPSIFWLNASDHFLISTAVAGVVVSSAVILGFLESLSLFVLWALYLSYVVVCQPFLNFQWDALLLEAGFLGIFFASPSFRPDWNRESGGARLARWLLLFLLFTLMFESGVVKLACGDDCWPGLTALVYHYQTQPLPLWTSWYMNQEPLWFEKISVLFTLFVEIAVPFCIFCPRNVRRVGCALLVLLQLIIAATGNYCFFNLLTIALCLLLLDDEAWPRWLRGKFSHPLNSAPSCKLRWSVWVVVPVACVDLFLCVFQYPATFYAPVQWPHWMAEAAQSVSAFETFNSYGLFRNMTRTRPEIIIEGSNDGNHWHAYEFKWKPGDVDRSPALVAPYQPRLDWQMWFAALSNVRQNPWFISLLRRLLEGSPEVLSLFDHNPFPGSPPLYIRANLYDYQFTTWGDRSGAWWKRVYLERYCPPISLDSFRQTENQ